MIIYKQKGQLPGRFILCVNKVTGKFIYLYQIDTLDKGQVKICMGSLFINKKKIGAPPKNTDGYGCQEGPYAIKIHRAP